MADEAPGTRAPGEREHEDGAGAETDIQFYNGRMGRRCKQADKQVQSYGMVWTRTSQKPKAVCDDPLGLNAWSQSTL